MERLICLAMGYIFGLFETGFIYGKLKGIDIRQHGSGNSGSTNTLRVLGKKAGIIVLIGDVLKCVIPCIITRVIFKDLVDMTLLLVLYTGFGVVLGHNFPFYMNFKGGKGIASTGGVIISVFDLRIFLICLAVFLLTVFITRYVSLGSILGVTSFFITWTVLAVYGALPIGQMFVLESCIVVFAFACLGIFRHRSNIKRLLTGTENKFGAKK
ncbi:Acyl-phosphate:glycerol-3-phosphate O-acyltransferase PlsY [Lachnospiraceae bacterium TWA4]|nr:Acyl-phosphate:glycerol-3-phosphate O-acyltransferase PlsY [Lachnospiraceae bacterium TWA4]